MQNRQIALLNPRNLVERFFMDDVFQQGFNSFVSGSEVEMYEENDNLVAEFHVPGFEQSDFDISIEDNVLRVAGNTKKEVEENKNRKYYFKEISRQSFARSINIPVRIQSDATNAEYKNGVLKITMPKAEEAKPKKIAIKAS